MTRRSVVSGVTSLAAGTAVAGAGALPAVLFELRNYTTRPGRCDTLIDLFERHFLDAYEAAGARVTGTFTHAHDVNRWVWIRAFADDRARGVALDRFYTSHDWLVRREVANETIEDIADALLLRPLSGELAALHAPGLGASAPPSVVECLRWFARPSHGRAMADRVLTRAVPALSALGVAPVAVLESVALPKAYPRLPLRDDPALVVLTRFADCAAYAAHRDARLRCSAWCQALDDIGPLAAGPPETWPLSPTSRSALR